MKISRTMQTLIKIFLGASAFTATTIGHATGNGIIIDGINFTLAQNLSFDGSKSTPVTYSDPFHANQSQPSSWMLDCSSTGYQSCSSQFTEDLKKATGDNITYLLLDFPSIDTDPLITKASTLNSCPIDDGIPGKFSPLEFNYVAPFIMNSPDLGPINVCVDGKKITQAFASQGHKVIPMISGSGSELDALNLPTKTNPNPTYLSTLAELIATEINQDPNASGVAFDLEPNIKGLADNQAFFGTLAQALKPTQKIILIYNGEWASIKQLPDTSQIVAMGAMYDFGLEDSATQNHWFQDISPTSYGIQFSKELTAFLNGDASTLTKVIVVPSAASDTLWTGLDILNNNEPDKTGLEANTPSSYDPYLVKAFDPKNNSGDPDEEPNAYANPNPALLLKMATPSSCPDSENNENCYTNPYSDAEIKGITDQDSYIKQALSPETLSAIQTGKLKGIIFYNIKPNNFYELNCSNPTQQNFLCMSFQPETTPASVITNLNDFESSLNSGS